MVDNVNPTSQFHPYQPETSVPASEKVASSTGLGSILSRFGIDSNTIGTLGNSMKNVDVKGQLNRARGVAQNNSGLVLGGLAALAIGAGLMRRRSMTK
jgi:LPXTG-motif cell wall-anchored protein